MRDAGDLWWFIQGKRLSSLIYPLINQRSRQFMQKSMGIHHYRKDGICHIGKSDGKAPQTEGKKGY
jgi:hypothetical protein